MGLLPTGRSAWTATDPVEECPIDAASRQYRDRVLAATYRGPGAPRRRVPPGYIEGW